ncbi:MAG: hypothetical protein R2764_23715 [Bacteroidales bacterium]
MKNFTKIIALIIVMASLTATQLYAQTVNVTFRVDMQEQTVTDDIVHIAGSFPAPYPVWNPAGILLNPPTFGDVYSITLTLEQGTYIEFKYVNGSAWGQDEWVNGPCSPGGGNRMLTVPNNDTILPLVWFGDCLPCILPPVNVTFQVDMSNETVSGNGVHVAGTFNNWTPGATPMTPIGNDIYSVTLTLGEGEYHEYKFINGNAWGGDESVPPGCANNNNRYYTVPSSPATLPAVCFGSCDPCTSVTDINVTFRVDMSDTIVAAEGVHLAGSIQGWDPAATLMTDLGNGIWEHTIVLQSGAYHEYKFVNGHAWGEDEAVPWYCNQNNNRYLTVPDNDTILPAVCYGSCLVCNPEPVDVTFKVDMSLQQVGSEGVHIAGSFQGWNPALTPMMDMGNNIYQITLTLGEGELHEYKFINGNDWPGAEFVPGECSNFGGNREFFVPSVATIFDTVCFGYCGPCEYTLYTFEINVFLEGPFEGTGMNTELFDQGVMATGQPFNVDPWNYDGGEMLSAQPGAGVVDWVYLEFRETDGDASTATPDKFLDHQAAVVLANGMIVQPDGSSPVLYTGDITQNLFVIVYHRNHLAVMSSSALVETNGYFVYDFTDDITKAYLDGQKAIGGGFYGMIGGDSDASGIVDTEDMDVNWSNDAGNAGYFGSDLNLDTQVSNPDKADVWQPNLGAETKVE